MEHIRQYTGWTLPILLLPWILCGHLGPQISSRGKTTLCAILNIKISSNIKTTCIIPNSRNLIFHKQNLKQQDTLMILKLQWTTAVAITHHSYKPLSLFFFFFRVLPPITCMVLLTWSDELTQTSQMCSKHVSYWLEKSGCNGSIHHTERSRLLNRICWSHGLGKSEAKITDPFVREGAYLKIFYRGCCEG